MVIIWKASATTFKSKHKKNKPLNCKSKVFYCNHFARKLIRRWNGLRMKWRDSGPGSRYSPRESSGVACTISRLEEHRADAQSLTISPCQYPRDFITLLHLNFTNITSSKFAQQLFRRSKVFTFRNKRSEPAALS